MEVSSNYTSRGGKGYINQCKLSRLDPQDRFNPHLGIRIELEHGSEVLEGVLLEGCVLGWLGLLGPDSRLDLIRVDDAGEI